MLNKNYMTTPWIKKKSTDTQWYKQTTRKTTDLTALIPSQTRVDLVCFRRIRISYYTCDIRRDNLVSQFWL